ncbi:MAG: hypothetical protein FD164_2047 [Nitrospirae bacterium]|nr:MAG: hypothetical protein FD164_2047 [Nitrospirota bacterium]
MQATLTDHAAVRAAQRNITGRDIEIITAYGRIVHCGGAVHLFLGVKDLPSSMRGDDSIAKLVGTTAVLAKDELTIITIYRNRQALGMLRRKSKWDLSRRGRRIRRTV